MIAAVALQFVQDPQEYPQDQITALAAAMVGFAVDVEENDIGRGGYRPLDVREEQGVPHLVREEVHGPAGLPVLGVRAIAEQVGKDLQQMRLPGTEKSRNPDPHLAGRIGIPALRHGFQIPVDELAEMLVEFAGDHELIQLLPDRGIVQLIGLHYPVDGPADIAFKQVFNQHVRLGYGTSLKAR